MTTQADFIRSDQLRDALVPIENLPALFNVSRSTIKRWLAADKLTRHPYKGSKFGDAPGKAIRFGDIIDAKDTTTGHWVKRDR